MYLCAECVRELVGVAQGCGYVASLASATLGGLVQSEVVRSAVLEKMRTQPIIRTHVVLPGE